MKPSALRAILIERASKWARLTGAPHYLSKTGVVFFQPYESDSAPLHGNFHSSSYGAIRSDSHWRTRLLKTHTRSPDRPGRIAAKETDSCTSSDALLLNLLCHPDAGRAISQRLGVDGPPEFGISAGIPKYSGNRLFADTSELDLVFRSSDRGRVSLIMEAKLSERTFTRKPKAKVESYSGLASVFDVALLNLDGDDFEDYQLIRNTLAAEYHRARFALIYDDRRPDLLARFQHVRDAVSNSRVSDRCSAVTWQELSWFCPSDLQEFLELKYAIEPSESS